MLTPQPQMSICIKAADFSADTAPDTAHVPDSAHPPDLCVAQDTHSLRARSFSWPGMTRTTVTCPTVINMQELRTQQETRALWIHWPGDRATPHEGGTCRCQSSVLWVFNVNHYLKTCVLVDFLLRWLGGKSSTTALPFFRALVDPVLSL